MSLGKTATVLSVLFTQFCLAARLDSSTKTEYFIFAETFFDKKKMQKETLVHFIFSFSLNYLFLSAGQFLKYSHWGSGDFSGIVAAKIFNFTGILYHEQPLFIFQIESTVFKQSHCLNSFLSKIQLPCKLMVSTSYYRGLSQFSMTCQRKQSSWQFEGLHRFSQWQLNKKL